MHCADYIITSPACQTILPLGILYRIRESLDETPIVKSNLQSCLRHLRTVMRKYRSSLDSADGQCTHFLNLALISRRAFGDFLYTDRVCSLNLAFHDEELEAESEVLLLLSFCEENGILI